MLRILCISVVALAGCGNSSNGSNDMGGGGPDLSAQAGGCHPTCSGAHVVCDPADNTCKLDGTTTNVGASCDTSGADPKCGTDPTATCNNATQDGYPGGYCSWEPCSTVKQCPLGSSCAHLAGESNACWKNCTSDGDCRSPDYGCFDIDPLYTAGASHKVCFLKMFACNTSADCPALQPTCSGADVDAGATGVCH